MRIGFVTCRPQPAITRDDALAARVLTRRGHRVDPVPWDAPGIPWPDYDLLVVRSTWNYHRVPEAFHAWLDEVEALGVAVANPVPALRWNARKSYLRLLEAAGLPVVPSRRVGSGRPMAPDAWAREFGTAEVVVKPLVGASAHGVARMRLGRDDEALREMAEGSELLVQPFLAEVESGGEWSAVFLGGSYSHAVLKRPAPGDFRVQEERGGRSEPGRAPLPVQALGRAALASAPGPALYARVDAVVTASGPLLMELELIEPALYLGSAPEAAARFADAVLGR